MVATCANHGWGSAGWYDVFVARTEKHSGRKKVDCELGATVCDFVMKKTMGKREKHGKRAMAMRVGGRGLDGG